MSPPQNPQIQDISDKILSQCRLLCETTGAAFRTGAVEPPGSNITRIISTELEVYKCVLGSPGRE